MAKKQVEVYELHPAGWESDPADEFFKLSTLDYTTSQDYINFAVYFKLPNADKSRIIPVLKRGLEITLSQCRQLCGAVEKHPDGGLCFHKTRGTPTFPTSFPFFAVGESLLLRQRSCLNTHIWDHMPRYLGH